MKIWKIVLPFAISIVIFVAVVHLTALYSRSGWTVERITQAFSCRASAFLRKAQVDNQELSWTELAALMTPSHGFQCLPGRRLEAELVYSGVANEGDLGPVVS